MRVSRVAKVKLCVFASAGRINCGHLGAAPLPAFAILRRCPPNTSDARGALVTCAESGVAPSARSATQPMFVLATTRSCMCSSILETLRLGTLVSPVRTCAMPPAVGMRHARAPHSRSRCNIASHWRCMALGFIVGLQARTKDQNQGKLGFPIATAQRIMLRCAECVARFNRGS